MLLLLQVATVLLVAVAMAMALAHALELPGKLRLDRQTYLAVQPIYYPGFTVAGGFGEGLGMVATLALLVATPLGSPPFYWILLALVALILMHATYWLVTHPVNKFWLKEQQLAPAGTRFFGFDPLRRRQDGASAGPEDWRRCRNRWEYSHVARAGFAVVALIALTVAVAL